MAVSPMVSNISDSDNDGGTGAVSEGCEVVDAPPPPPTAAAAKGRRGAKGKAGAAAAAKVREIARLFLRVLLTVDHKQGFEWGVSLP